MTQGGQLELVDGSPLSPLILAGFWIIALHRFGSWSRTVSVPMVGLALRMCYRVVRLFLTTLTGARINAGATLGRRVAIHTTQGLMVADDVRIGNGSVLNAGVCLVHAANNRGTGGPTIGENVYLGVGSKILGGVNIGDNCQIGANVVIMQDVPASTLVISEPPAQLPRPGFKRRKPQPADRQSPQRQTSAGV